MKYIGYVSTPFGTKKGTNFDALYTEAIFPSPGVAIGTTNILLFREDGRPPRWNNRHKTRIERYRGGYQTHEWQLRQAIQDNIIGADFLIAVLTDFNPNVMLEIGFAQAQKKIIVYILRRDQFNDLPANLANLKRLHLYKSKENLRVNLYNRFQEVVSDLDRQYADISSHGGFFLNYHVNRDAVGLVQKFSNARKNIQILTTNLTTVSANYIDAVVRAVKQNPGLNVRILTSDPENEFINPRAKQLDANPRGYRMELQGSLESIRAELARYKNCEVRTYKDFPVQLWHLIDDYIYVGQSSLVTRTRHNCVFEVSVDTEGAKKTYLDHFDRLWEKAGEDQRARSKGPAKRKTQKAKRPRAKAQARKQS